MADTKRNCGLNISHMFQRLAPGLSFAILILFAITSWAGVGGSISGTVKDASGAVVPNAGVNVINVETGVQHQTATNGQGFYSFANLPIGRYSIAIQKTGFKPYRRTGVRVDAHNAPSDDADRN